MKLIARLPDWTECHLEILGIGDFYIFGRIVDNEDPYLVRSEEMFEKDLPWCIEISGVGLEPCLN